jgi:hypothetical protein
MSSLLPTATQSLVQLDQCSQLVSPRLRQFQFGREVVGVVRENFNVVRGSDFEAHLRETRSILRGVDEMLLLDPEFLVLCNQSVRDIAKRALNRLLIGEQELLSLGFCEAKVGFNPSTLEDRLRECPN